MMKYLWLFCLLYYIVDTICLPTTEGTKTSNTLQLNMNQPRFYLKYTRESYQPAILNQIYLSKIRQHVLSETSPRHIFFSAWSHLWILQKVVKLPPSAFLRSYFPYAAQTSCFHFYHSSNHTRMSTSSSAWNSTPNISGIWDQGWQNPREEQKKTELGKGTRGEKKVGLRRGERRKCLREKEAWESWSLCQQKQKVTYKEKVWQKGVKWG